MPLKDLRQFIDLLESQGDLRIVEGVDWSLEVGTLTEIACEREAPAFVFDKISGYPPGHRIAVNLLSTYRRALVASGLPTNLRGVEIVKAWREKLRSYRPVPPERAP